MNWRNVLFLVLTPPAAVVGTAVWLANGQFHWLTVALAVLMSAITGLGITAGYHRLFSHRSFDAHPFVRWALALAGGACFEGSVWEWCVDHRQHHRAVDSDRDPYSIRKGFWYAHLLWLFRSSGIAADARLAPDLWKDPVVRLQHRFYVPLAVVGSFALPMGIAALWGDVWGGLFVAGLARIVFNQHCTFAINSVCHTFGKQTYSDAHTSRDNWVTALFTFGEGYHNFHHAFPIDYRNGIRFYHWDPTKWLIRALALVGLARNLRQLQPEVILLTRCSLAEKRLLAELEEQPRAFVEFARSLIRTTRQAIEESGARLKSLRRQSQASLQAGGEARRRARRQLRLARREFERTVALWDAVARRLHRLLPAAPAPA